MLAVVVNHNHTANAVALKESLGRRVKTLLLDSGSALEPEHATAFDRLLPNVYYSGLLNAAVGLASDMDPADPLLFVCSDVVIPDVELLVTRIGSAFSDRRLHVYAPVSHGARHPQLRPRESDALRKVSFVEGFCFAATKRVLDRICPVDVSVNRLGWGIDICLGYQAVRLGGYSAVDDVVEVEHPVETGYDRQIAAEQMSDWFGRMPASARRYAQLARRRRFREGVGYGMVRLLYACVAPA
jgi:hypothetical protein